MSSNIRLSEKTHRLLKLLAAQQGSSMQAVLEQAVNAYHKQIFFRQMNRGFQNLKSNPRPEREAEDWNGVLMDGMESFPYEA